MKNNNIGKFISLLVVVFVISAILSSCNQTILDTKWHFDKAVVQLGDFSRTVTVASWKDFEDSNSGGK